jgi:DNA-binding protein YbaB
MDMESLMAQAAELQTKVASAQEKLANTNVKGLSSDGMCIIDMTCKYDMTKVVINPNALASGADAIANAVLSAYQDAKSKADKIIDDVMSAATAGMSLPQ